MLGGPAAGAGDGLAVIPSAVIPEQTQDLNGLSEQVTMSSPHTQGGSFQGQRVDCNWLSCVPLQRHTCLEPQTVSLFVIRDFVNVIKDLRPLIQS